ncbi:MAG: hypothetical protein L3K23_06635 [Thermoplasmata archaeon]|nr:hypothetical protein [Thermoplasmata archaeon]
MKLDTAMATMSNPAAAKARYHPAPGPQDAVEDVDPDEDPHAEPEHDPKKEFPGYDVADDGESWAKSPGCSTAKTTGTTIAIATQTVSNVIPSDRNLADFSPRANRIPAPAMAIPIAPRMAYCRNW